MSPIDEYLTHVSPSQKDELERVRKIIKQVAPEVLETITWEMPTFKYKHKNLIHFAAFKDHMSLFPGAEVVENFKDKLKEHVMSKGTIQFTEEKPVSESIIKEIVSARVTAISDK